MIRKMAFVFAAVVLAGAASGGCPAPAPLLPADLQPYVAIAAQSCNGARATSPREREFCLVALSAYLAAADRARIDALRSATCSPQSVRARVREPVMQRQAMLVGR